MTKQELDSKLRRQALSYPQVARAQVEGFRRGMREASFPPDEVLRDIRHIYITGSGDCNAAAAICKPVVEKLLGGFSAKVYVDTPLHVGRYLSLVASDDNPAVAAQTLLIGLSVWGFPARVVECLRRAENWASTRWISPTTWTPRLPRRRNTSSTYTSPRRRTPIRAAGITSAPWWAPC